MLKHPIAPYLMILIAGILWGATFSLAIIATSRGAHPLVMTAWQVLLTSCFFAAILRSLKKLDCFLTDICIFMLFIAVTGIIAPDLLYYNATPTPFSRNFINHGSQRCHC